MCFVLTLFISFYWQGDPGEDGAPGKPGTAVVRWQHITCHESAVTRMKHLLLIFFSESSLCASLSPGRAKGPFEPGHPGMWLWIHSLMSLLKNKQR